MDVSKRRLATGKYPKLVLGEYAGWYVVEYHNGTVYNVRLMDDNLTFWLPARPSPSPDRIFGKEYRDLTRQAIADYDKTRWPE